MTTAPERPSPWMDLNKRFVVPQRGVIARWQALGAGVPATTYDRHVRRYGYARPGGGVALAPGSADTHERDCWAALVAVRLRGVLTAESVLFTAGALRRRPPRVALWLPPSSHLAGLAGTRHHRGRWVADDRVERRKGLPCAGIPRAVTDYAADHGVEELIEVVAALHRLREELPGELAAYIDRRGAFHGCAGLRSALALVDGTLVHSGAEAEARRLLTAVELPFALHPHPLTIALGDVLLGEIDLPFPEVRYGVEVDGPHHLLPSVVEADKVRDRRLRREVDWIVDRFTVAEIERAPQQFVRQVAEGLRAAGTRQVAPWF